MEAGDIADAVTYIVTRPRHVAVNEMLIRPTDSSGNRHRQVARRTSAPTCPVLRSVQVHTKPGPVECAPPALHTSRSGDLVKPGSHIRSPCCM